MAFTHYSITYQSLTIQASGSSETKKPLAMAQRLGTAALFGRPWR
jgi:hypothetical protein